MLAAGLFPAAAEATDWYPEITENRPFTRWWWLGSAVDPEGLTFNLEEFAKKGMGGVEITPIYGVQGNEKNDIPYLSDKWMDMLAYTIKEGDRLGLQIDMKHGICPAVKSSKIRYVYQTLASRVLPLFKPSLPPTVTNV